MEGGEGKVCVTSAEPPKEKPRVMYASFVHMASTFASKKIGFVPSPFFKEMERGVGGGGVCVS